MDNRKNKMMDDGEIAALLRSLAIDSVQALYEESSDIIGERTTALSYYRGQPLGNEQEYTSDFVTRDVREVVDNAQANLMRVFCADDESVVSFNSMGPEDAEAAKQATDYIHHCLMNKNNGVQIINTWIKDALLQKNGIIKFYWDEWSEVDKIKFKDMPESEMDHLLATTDMELDYDPEETKVDNEIHIDIDPLTSEEIEIEVEGESTFSGHFKIIKPMSGAKVLPIPVEDFIIDRWASDIHDAKYVAHKSRMTISELKLMGFEFDIDDIIGSNEYDNDDASGYQSFEEDARHGNSYLGDLTGEDNNKLDKSMRTVTVMEEYAYFDEDGDDIAELHKVIRVGDTILENVIVSEIPFANICPFPTSHTFYGDSVADQVIEIQYANTELTRGLLDNLRLANTGRFAVMEGQVNLTDMLDNRPNALVRTKAPPSQAIQPLPHGTINPATFEMIGRLDAAKDRRSGVPSQGAGLGGNELKSHAGATANMEFMSRADATLEQIARNFTTGFKRLYKGLYQLYRENSVGKETVEGPQPADVMTTPEGKQDINPQMWPRRDNVNVQVALGRNDKDRKAAELEKLLQLGMASPQVQQLIDGQKGYNLLKDILILRGIDYSRYLMNPQEAQNSPEKQAAQKKAAEEEAIMKQMTMEGAQADLAEKKAKAKKTDAEGMNIIADNLREDKKLEIETLKAEAEIQIEIEQQRPVDIG